MAVMEAMEGRRYFAAAAVRPITVAFNPTNGTLGISGTPGDDDIRYVQTGPLTAKVYAFAPAPAGTTLGKPVYDLGKNDKVVPVHVKTIRTAAGPEFEMYADIDLTHVLRTQVDGYAGDDVMRVVNLRRPPSTTIEVEHTYLTPAATAPGDTPSDPATGRRFNNRAKWLAYANALVAQAAKSTATTAFLGDSHVERWNSVGLTSWNRYFSGALDLGISGDGTRQLLYRINVLGQFDHYKPKRVVLMIGTNNFNDLSSGTDAQVEAGIATVIAAVRKKVPGVKVLLLGILPRRYAGFNARVQSVNAVSASLADGRNVFFMNQYARFVGSLADGNVNPDLYDSFDEHLDAHGYDVLSSYVAPILRTLG